MTKRKTYRLALLSLLAVPLFTAVGCGENVTDGESDFKEGIPSEVSFSISALTPMSTATRADGIPLTPAIDNEKIKDWFLVFIDKTGTVSKILSCSQKVPVEEETFKCIIPSGTYDIYAFANITSDELTNATGLKFTEGQTVKIEDINNAIWKGLNETDGAKETESSTALGNGYDAIVSTVSNDNLNLWNATEDIGKPIPMTGHITKKIENKIEESFSIEVVRMVAKVELEFLNPGNEAVTINSVAISPVTVSPVSLFPNYSILGESAYTPLTGAEYARLIHNLPQVMTVPVKTDSEYGKEFYSFYLKESLSNATGSFTVWLDVTYTDGVKDFIQYNPTIDIKDYINRNDWIKIPLTLSQYDVKVEAVFYPPIGGYPAINEGMDPDGSHEFTFGTQGKFAIMPYVTDKMTGTLLTSGRYRIEVDEILYKAKGDGAADWKNVDWTNAGRIYGEGKADDTDTGIFTTMPVKVDDTSTALPYEMPGELNTEQGIARVTIKVHIYEDKYMEGAKPKHTYTKYIYIIRDNAG